MPARMLLSAVPRGRLFFFPLPLRSLTMCFVLIAIAATGTAEDNPFQAVRTHLDNHSQIDRTDENQKPTSRIETHLEKYAGGKFVLIYERWEYAGDADRQPASIQMITYTFRLEDLDASTLRAIEWKDDSEGDSIWMAEIRVRTSAEFIPYKNYTDTFAAGALVDRSTSKGKSRTVTLGYFRTRELADQCIRSVADWIAPATHPAR